MAGRVITETELLAGLHDIELPAAIAGGQNAQILAAAGLGLLLAYCLGIFWPAITKTREKSLAPDINDRIAATRSLSGDERAIALLHLIRDVDPDVAEKFSASIYKAGGLPNVADMESVLKNRVHANV